MISIVIVGRNDDYGGDFEARVLATLRYNTRVLRQRGIAFEVVFVEWNPLEDRPWLSQRLLAEFDDVRSVVVDGALHRHLCRNRHIAVYEYHAKNVGARFARGEWLLLTNPDNFLGEGVIRFFADAAYDQGTLYRAGRADVDDVGQVDDPDFPDRFAGDGPPFPRASGDFLFLSRELFDRIGGFREDLRFANTHKDSIFVLTAGDLGVPCEKIGVTYHLRHAREDAALRRPQYAFRRARRSPQPRYGHADESAVERIGPRQERLVLRPELVARTTRRSPPEPRIPWRLRPPRKTWLRRRLRPPWLRRRIRRLRKRIRRRAPGAIRRDRPVPQAPSTLERVDPDR